MPPKKVEAGGPSKKTALKKKEKVVEDKTFGLKNKKGAKTQKFIQTVQKTVIGVPKPNESKAKKEEKAKEAAELASIFKPVAAAQKVEQGVDPKSVLCAFFKQGQCGKGDKCKFSHDLEIERKTVKKSVYVDIREENQDTMDTWDETKLADVVEKKHGEIERKMPKTDIICKHFLDALETNKYGWFWDCPNGGNSCHYRHCLPPGFVLKKDKKRDKKDDISIEDLVERERAKLGYNLVRVTLGSFLDWKKLKIEEKKLKALDDMDKKKAEFKAGRHVGLSGKDMFTFNPDLVADDQDDDDGDTFDSKLRERDEDEEGEESVRELDMEKLAQQAHEADGSGTVAQDRQFQVDGDDEVDERRKTGAEPSAAAATEFDADLFDDEDIGDLDEELERATIGD